MPLPLPLPDDPRKWDGWRSFDSTNYYERLCFAPGENPSDAAIEDQCRQLLVWWQKKLPLKSQPSNPIAQLLWAGMDAAPQKLSQARSELLRPESRARIDAEIRAKRREVGLLEFRRFLDFALSDNILTKEEESSLRKLGDEKGLSSGDMDSTIDAELQTRGAQRADDMVEAAPEPAATPAQRRMRTNRLAHISPTDEFKRMLSLSGLDSDSMTDDQRDALINMAENLGLDAGDAENMVDDYLESVEATAGAAPAAPPATPAVRAPAARGSGPSGGAQRAALATPAIAPPAPMTPDAERARYPDFVSETINQQFVLVPSGFFMMGSTGSGAAANEQPTAKVTLSRFYIGRQTITNEQYELFDPSHRSKRLVKADKRHPVVYVSSLEAIKFCQWLSSRERKRYRLPTEAEWEFAARGTDGRTYPWGETVGRGDLANFADANTAFAWSDRAINDGFAETSPVGSFPRGASPFGLEDMAGNVWEWCMDYYDAYKGAERTNPPGPRAGSQRILRGGSWKSRFNSLRASARSFNAPNFAANDVGFRVVCECD
jgi:formylglycine-generating enzyme required for sulfatase activity